MFYAGRVNGLIGESESGKTWLALLAVCQELDAGHHVLYVDPEDTAPGVIDRLRALGATDEQLATQLAYINPDEPLSTIPLADFREISAARPWSLVVVDGVNAAMTLLGLEMNDNTDATRFAQAVLRPLTSTGAAVVVVDHLPKNNGESKGGIGAQAKRAMMTGCSIRVVVTNPFGRGLTGELALTIDKDRPGHVRGNSAQAKHVGTAVLASDGTKMTVTVNAPSSTAAVPSSDRENFRPTRVMGEVSRWLAGTDGDTGWSGRQIISGVGRKRDVVLAALDRLVEAGYVRREPGPRNSVLHHHVHRYSELNELIETDEED